MVVVMHSRARMTEADNPVPNRVQAKVFAVVVPCFLIAFILAGQVSAFLWHRLAPYLVFGIEEARRQSIAVTVSGRHYFTFSNGVTVDGWKYLLLELAHLPIFLVLFVALSFLLLRIGAWVMKRRDAEVSHGVLHFWRVFKRNHDA